MSPAERATESILLKQRWSLIQSGSANGQSIRIKGSRLLINGRVHGQVIDSQYCTYPLLSDFISPHLNPDSTSVNAPGANTNNLSVSTMDPINTQDISDGTSDRTIADPN